MVREEALAAAGKQTLVARGAAARRPDLAEKHALALYRRRVKANRRRLAKR